MSFSRVRCVPIPALGLEFQEWRHPSGCLHLHLACADEHRAFCCALRTPPDDSTGKPHILEHTVLCGSRRFPVRDPFFNMLRRSLQTFMNAFTYGDLTAYPFATQVPKDFANLLDVYLDAVFSPLLDPLDFAQEGHRLEPGPDASWVRKGVVFNEMKGAMGNTAAQLAEAQARLLLPQTIYRHNSGGDPAAIPALDHQGLVAFHRRCYCAANAVFCTYGALDPEDLHSRLRPWLASPGRPLPPPALQAPLPAPVEALVPVPWVDGQDIEDVTACGVAWCLGDAADPDAGLDLELADRLLGGHAGAPLRLALESAGVARASACGASAAHRNAEFSADWSGLAPGDCPRLWPLVQGCLERVVREGLDATEVDAALHQVELARREVRGDGHPYGLELCLRLLPAWNWGVDPLPFLDQDAAIARLRKRATAPGWLQDWVGRNLLGNPHRVQLTAQPDRDWERRREAEERATCAAEAARLDEAGRGRLADQARALAERQSRKDDPDLLPDLALADVPAQRRWAEGRQGEGLWTFRAATNGLLHHLAAFPLPRLDAEELDLLPLLTHLVGQVGSAGRSYTQEAAFLNARCGGLHAWTDLAQHPEDPTRINALLLCEVKGLADRATLFLDLVASSLRGLRCDEPERLRELLEQSLQSQTERVPWAGHRLAARAALRSLTPAAALAHRLGGLGRLTWLKRNVAAVAEDAPASATALQNLGAALDRLRRRILAQPPILVLIGDAAERPDLQAAVRAAWGATPAGGESFRPCPPEDCPATAWTCAGSVSHCALAFNAPPLGHADAPALAVAGALLTHQQLHRTLREQGGAYGGSASYQAELGGFALVSYRDPRFGATYADMRLALRWLTTCPDDPRILKEAVLAVIAGLDAPGSPAGEARHRFLADLKQAGPVLADRFRARVLEVDAQQVRAAACRWLDPEGGRQAAVTTPDRAAQEAIGWEIQTV